MNYRGKYDFFVSIYNAKLNQSGSNLIPDKALYSSDIYNYNSPKNDTGWFSYNFNNAIINKSKTEQGVFFVIINASLSGTQFDPFIEWGYVEDISNGDNGDALYYESVWELNSIDLGLKVDISAFLYPENYNMTINDSMETSLKVINGMNPGVGKVILSKFIPSRNITIKIIASSNISFYLNTNTQLLNKTYAKTQFYSYYNSRIVNINITMYSVNFIGIYNTLINFTLHKTWNISSVYINGSLISISDYIRYDDVLIINATDGNYSIHCIDNNYIKSFDKYVEGNKREKIFYNENLTINSTLLINNSQSDINLTIFNSSNYKIYQDLKSSSNYHAIFNPFNMTRAGEYIILLTWFNGTMMGFNITNIEVVYHTKLINISDNIVPLISIEPGNKIRVNIYYNNTDLNTGITNSTEYFNLNLTSSDQYNISEYGNGYYNITIFTNQLISDNYTVQISVKKLGFQSSTKLIYFSIKSSFEALLNITSYYGNAYINGKWWIKPNPYFDDQTHKVEIYYRNASVASEGIYPAIIYAYPNWTDDVWYGNQFDLEGRYDMSINTYGLNEGDRGEILIIATSNNFETKEIKIYLEINQIPENLLSFDVSGFEEITAYEGETIQIAANFVDDFHDYNIIFNNEDEGNLTWSIPGTTASSPHLMQKLIQTYNAYISLPDYQIEGGMVYNITITGKSAINYATKSINITLHILEKEISVLEIINSTDSDIRIGKSLKIISRLTYLNGTSLSNQVLNFNLSFYDNQEILGHIKTNLLTNSTGHAIYIINEILERTKTIVVNVSYMDNQKIASISSSLEIPVLDKYNSSINLLINKIEDIRIGKPFLISANLNSSDLGLIPDVALTFNITFYNRNESLIKSEITNQSGIATLKIDKIPENTIRLEIKIKYRGNKTINSCNLSAYFNVLAKYTASLE
ncbi:MAG: hypothetical protein GF329_06675, partial [Candidatus Lokiarchaeota archaeon]|nr:hypothetical protein [Candidatus Lokiarchaeota archaeon]